MNGSTVMSDRATASQIGDGPAPQTDGSARASANGTAPAAVCSGSDGSIASVQVVDRLTAEPHIERQIVAEIAALHAGFLT